jgi:hypothetical protein
MRGESKWKKSSFKSESITEDVIDIRDGKAPVLFKLLLEETVLWKDSKGKVGATDFSSTEVDRPIVK